MSGRDWARRVINAVLVSRVELRYTRKFALDSSQLALRGNEGILVFKPGRQLRSVTGEVRLLACETILRGFELRIESVEHVIESREESDAVCRHDVRLLRKDAR